MNYRKELLVYGFSRIYSKDFPECLLKVLMDKIKMFETRDYFKTFISKYYQYHFNYSKYELRHFSAYHCTDIELGLNHHSENCWFFLVNHTNSGTMKIKINDIISDLFQKTNNCVYSCKLDFLNHNSTFCYPKKEKKHIIPKKFILSIYVTKYGITTKINNFIVNFQKKKIKFYRLALKMNVSLGFSEYCTVKIL